MGRLGMSRFLQFFLMLLCFAALAHAQAVAVAQVSGIVSDPAGMVIVGAQVSIVDTEKGQVRSTGTDGTGSYTLPNLPVGPYRLEVRAQGFKDYIQTGLVL